MSIVAYEYVVAKVCEDTLQWVRENPYFVDLAVATHRADLRESLRRIVTEGKVQVVLEYSFKKPSFPAYVIFLEQESESHQHVGDTFEEPLPLRSVEIEEVTEPLTFQPFPYFTLQNFPILQCRIFCNGEPIPDTDFSLNATNGKGVLLGEYSEQATYTAVYRYFSKYEERKGALFNCTLRVDTIANNFDECLLLSRFLVYILLSMRPFLSGCVGMKNQLISLSPPSMYLQEDQPEPLYVRTLRLNFDVDGYGIVPLSVLRKIEIRNAV